MSLQKNGEVVGAFTSIRGPFLRVLRCAWLMAEKHRSPTVHAVVFFREKGESR
jgi:hypothetical protein